MSAPAPNETVAYACKWGVRRFDEEATRFLAERIGREPLGIDFDAAHIAPYLETEVEKNIVTNVGLTRMTNRIVGVTAQPMTGPTGTPANTTRIGVGVGTTPAETRTDTDLAAAAGAANRQFVLLDSGFPAIAVGVITLQATFGGTLANFAWNEFGIDIADTAPSAAGTTVVTPGILFNHRVGIAQGTKVSGQTWVASSTITIA